MSARGGRWIWLARLLAFAGLFLLLGFAAVQLLLFLGIPVGTEPQALDIWVVGALLFAALLASWIMTRRIEGRPMRTLGLRGGPSGLAQLGLGTLAGIALIGAAILAMALAGWIEWTPEPGEGSPIGAALRLAGLLFGAAFVEELLFRGYPFQLLERRFSPWIAIGATSIGFGALHGANPNVGPLALVNITIAGVLLAVAYWRTGSLWVATGVHLGWNWTMAVTELSVSGLPEFDVPGVDPTVSGPIVWTGGAFGPEGGLVITLVSLAGVMWMWRLGGGREKLGAAGPPGPGVREAPPARDARNGSLTDAGAADR